MENVRDAAQKLGRFTTMQMLTELGIRQDEAVKVPFVNMFINDLMNAGTIKVLRPGSYEYQRPTGTSPARPRQATPESAASSAPRRGGSVTHGGAPKAGRKEVQELLDAAQRQWVPQYGPIQSLGSGHFQIPHPDGPAGRFLIGNTPSSGSHARDRAKLRKAGLKGI